MHRTRTAHIHEELRLACSGFYFRIGTVITFSYYAKASTEENLQRFFTDRHSLSFTINPAGTVRTVPASTSLRKNAVLTPESAMLQTRRFFQTKRVRNRKGKDPINGCVHLFTLGAWNRYHTCPPHDLVNRLLYVCPSRC